MEALKPAGIKCGVGAHMATRHRRHHNDIPWVLLDGIRAPYLDVDPTMAAW
jgi:hypothetical protein